MRIVDGILYKRLERIRGDLDAYIATRIEDDHHYVSMSIICPQVRDEKAVGKKDKFLHYMKLEQEVSDFSDDESWEKIEKIESDNGPTASQTESYMSTPSFSCPQMSDRPSGIPTSGFFAKTEQKKSIDEVLENKAETFSTMLLRLIDEKGLKDSEVYKNANIDRRLFSKIRGDEDYVPSKKTAIAFCLALQLDIQETKKLLEAAGYALSCASRFDLIIMYLIDNKEFNIHFANIVLEDYGEGTLSK